MSSTTLANLDCTFFKSTLEFVVSENGKAHVPLVPPFTTPWTRYYTSGAEISSSQTTKNPREDGLSLLIAHIVAETKNTMLYEVLHIKAHRQNFRMDTPNPGVS